MRWPGFRRVRRQVNKRVSRRVAELGLPDAAAYREYLDSNPREWTTLASLCRVTVTRFYRDRRVFDHLGEVVLPRLAARAGGEVACWSVGCASGEEPYTVKIIWELSVAPAAAGKTLHVLATDSDPLLLSRAREAVYPASSLKDLPHRLAAAAFESCGEKFALHGRFRKDVHFEERDVRESMPAGPFDVILCRNLVFTYFETDLQRTILRGMKSRLRGGGVLVTGIHESLPANHHDLTAETRSIYKKTG